MAQKPERAACTSMRHKQRKFVATAREPKRAACISMRHEQERCDATTRKPKRAACISISTRHEQRRCDATARKGSRSEWHASARGMSNEGAMPCDGSKAEASGMHQHVA